MTPRTVACQAPLSMEILQARILEWVAMPSSGGLPNPEIQPRSPPGALPNPGIQSSSPTMQVDYLPSEPPGKPKNTGVGSLSLLQGIFPIQESNHDLLHCRFFTTIQLLKSKIWHHLTFNILFNIKKHLTFNTLVLKKLRSWHLVPSLYGK